MWLQNPKISESLRHQSHLYWTRFSLPPAFLGPTLSPVVGKTSGYHLQSFNSGVPQWQSRGTGIENLKVWETLAPLGDNVSRGETRNWK